MMQNLTLNTYFPIKIKEERDMLKVWLKHGWNKPKIK